MSYRIESSKTKQAGCQNKPCKDEGIKIQKGELRFGSWVVIQEHGSFRWRHWGCVSGKILENLREYLEQGDPETGYKWDYFDGLDELEPSDQEKVKKAVIEGKISDEDWKGDPECNVLGQSGTVKKAPRKKAKKGEEDNVEDDDKSPDPPKKQRGKKSRPKTEDDDEEEEPKPGEKPHGKKSRTEGEEDTKSAVKRERKVKMEIKDENDDGHSVPASKSKSRAKRAVKNEPVSGDEDLPIQNAVAKRKGSKNEASSNAEVNINGIPHKMGSAKDGVNAEVKSDDRQEDIKPIKAASKKATSKKYGSASVKMESGDDEPENVKPVRATATKKKATPKKRVKKEGLESDPEEDEVKPVVSSRADRAAKRAASDLSENKKPAKRGRASAQD